MDDNEAPLSYASKKPGWVIRRRCVWGIVLSPLALRNKIRRPPRALVVDRRYTVGGYFHNDLKRAVEEVQLSAMVTHSHPEGKAGAIAVAVAAAIAENRPYPKENDFLKEVLPFVTDSITKDHIHRATQISPDALTEAMFTLGTGSEVSAQDTVPFCLWSAAHHLDNFEEALWWIV